MNLINSHWHCLTHSRHLVMVQHSLQHSGALGESVWVRRVNNEDEAVHFVIIFGPNSTEAFAATKIIDSDMVALEKLSSAISK